MEQLMRLDQILTETASSRFYLLESINKFELIVRRGEAWACG